MDPYTRVNLPITRSVVITPHNTNPLPEIVDELFIGGPGTVVVRLAGDTSDRTLRTTVSGAFCMRITHIRATGTTATDMLGFFYQ